MGHLEVPPPHYTLQPAGQTGGGLHPGRRSPGGDGGVMGLGTPFFLSDNRIVFQWRPYPNSVSHNFSLFLTLLSVLDKESCELKGARQMERIKINKIK